MKKPAPTYKLMADRCDQCLTTPQRIVSGARAAEIIRGCRKGDMKFICHKTSDVACRGVHEAIGPCRAKRFADAFGIETTLVDPATLEERA